jgi:hypothetical protein
MLAATQFLILEMEFLQIEISNVFIQINRSISGDDLF